MLFSSPLFLFLFLPIVLLAYFALDRRFHNGVLLFASLAFYAWGEKWLVSLMLLAIVANFGFGLWVERAQRSGTGRPAVCAAVFFNVGILLFFKYADWLWQSIGTLVTGHEIEPLGSLLVSSEWGRLALLKDTGQLRLPLGISFFTFCAMSYVVDVYRREVGAQRSLLNFALYKSLFPQLIAGPIVRYKDVDDQINSRTVSWSGFAHGVRRFVIGLGKKMLIANAAAEVADKIFDLPGDVSTPAAWLGIVAYSIQIYFDFSGYSDMAIGLGHMFGFTFLENFNYPYIARSVTEFWRRWHMSLSTWFRDYLYIPLGGNRGSSGRTYFNLVLVFFVCGLWHGASANFVIWGLYHGAFLVIERLGLGRWLEQRSPWLRHAYLLVVVMVGWVFFRAAEFPHALRFLRAMVGGGANSALEPLGLFVDARIATVLLAGIVGSMPWLPRLRAWHERRLAAGFVARSIALEAMGLLLVAVVLLLSSFELASNSYNPFIYFRF